MQTPATHSPFDNIRFALCYVPSQRDAQTLVEEETLCDDEMKEDYPDAHFSFPNPDHFIHGEHEFFQTPTDLYAYMQPEYIYEPSRSAYPPAIRLSTHFRSTHPHCDGGYPVHHHG